MTVNVTDSTPISTTNCCGCETPIILPLSEGDFTIPFTLDMSDGTVVKYGVYETKIVDGAGVIELNEGLKLGEVQIQVNEENCQTLAFINVTPNPEKDPCKINVINFETQVTGEIATVTSLVTDTPKVLYRLDNGEWSENYNFELELGKSYNIGIKSAECRTNYPVLILKKNVPVPYGIPSSTPALLAVPTAVPTITFTPVSVLVPTNVPTPVSVPVGVATPTPVAFITLVPFNTPISTPVSTPTPLCVPSGVPTPVTTPIGVPTPITCEPFPSNVFYEYQAFGNPPFPYTPYTNTTGLFISLLDAQTAKSQCIAGTLVASGTAAINGNSINLGEPFYSSYSLIVGTCGVMNDGFYIVTNIFSDPIVAGTKIIEISAGVIVSINT